MSELLNLETELATNARRQTLNGREFVVADVVMLKEGVLNGSKGPLFYPLEEIARYPGMWNGFPLTTPTHPLAANGLPISARSPEAWNRYTVGYIFNDRMVGKARHAEIWVDVEIANKLEPRLVPRVLSNKPINVSTGLFTTDERLAQNMTWTDGKTYTHIARNYRPDHLAILLDDLGACSVRDGCGVNVNASPQQKQKGNYPSRCPYCDAPMEIDPANGVCNRCGKKVAKLAVNYRAEWTLGKILATTPENVTLGSLISTLK